MAEDIHPNREEPYEVITVQTTDGRTLYWPSGDLSRLAPAAVCAVASRLVALRREIALLDPGIQVKLQRFLGPLPFEDKFLSGNIVEVHGAIRVLGQSAQAPLIVIQVEGGVVGSVHSSDSTIQVHLWDHDQLDEDGVSIEEREKKFKEKFDGCQELIVAVPNFIPEDVYHKK